MINKSYDSSSPAIISPHQTIKAEEKQIAANIRIDVFIMVFSHQLIDHQVLLHHQFDFPHHKVDVHQSVPSLHP